MASLTKIDTARRQLLAAIHLHWFCVEPIAVYQLASNASELCAALLKWNGETSVKDHVAEMQGWNVKQVNDLINVARNFAKHADRDPKEELEDITFEQCNGIILTACIDYCMVAKRSPAIVGSFMIWFAATHPVEMGTTFETEAAKLFPDLDKAPLSDQIMAARSHVQRPPDREVLNNSRNELSDNWRWKDLRDHGQHFRTE